MFQSMRVEGEREKVHLATLRPQKILICQWVCLRYKNSINVMLSFKHVKKVDQNP
jgi:hypothetical protein